MRKLNHRKSLALIAIAGSAGLVAATVLDGLTLDPGSRVWVEGTSTVRDWSCEATAIESDIVPTAEATAALAVDRLVRSATVAIPVEQLDCRNGTMNGHMKKALRVKEHPAILFELDRYAVDGDRAVLEGTLAMAGSTRPIVIEATVQEEDAGVVRVQAEHRLNMTEWGIKPPSLMLGTMKVHDPVTVRFDVTLTR